MSGIHAKTYIDHSLKTLSECVCVSLFLFAITAKSQRPSLSLNAMHTAYMAEPQRFHGDAVKITIHIPQVKSMIGVHSNFEDRALISLLKMLFQTACTHQKL